MSEYGIETDCMTLQRFVLQVKFEFVIFSTSLLIFLGAKKISYGHWRSYDNFDEYSYRCERNIVCCAKSGLGPALRICRRHQRSGRGCEKVGRTKQRAYD